MVAVALLLSCLICCALAGFVERVYYEDVEKG
jgi:hypothetical protein